MCEIIDLTGYQKTEIVWPFICLYLPEYFAGHAGDRFLGKIPLDLVATESAGYGPADPAAVLAAVYTVT